MDFEQEFATLTNIATVKACNSVGYLEWVFDRYQAGRPFAVVTESSQKALSDILTDDADATFEPAPGGGWFSRKLEMPGLETLAQIVFSSGTEGEPKAIALSYRNLNNMVDRVNQVMEVDGSIREYIGVPVYHSFGLGRVRAVSAAGGSCFIPEKGFDPSEVARMLVAEEINALSVVPSLLRVVLDNPDMFRECGGALRWMEIGSQAMSLDDKRRVKALFPNASIVQHYGLTEASRSTLLRLDRESGEHLDSVGRVDLGVDVQVSDQGLLRIKGPNVAMGQILRGRLVSIVDEDGWYQTSDLGHLKEGYLYFEGRKGDMINCGGIKLSPDLLEKEIVAISQGAIRPAVSKYIDQQRGEGVLVAIEGGAGVSEDGVLSVADWALQAFGVNARSAIRVLPVKQFPRTSTGKIRRDVLAKSYRDSAARPESEITSQSDNIIGLYRQIFRRRDISRDDTFSSLGGDSLNFVDASIKLHRIFDVVPAGWEGMTIAELEAASGKDNKQVGRGSFWRTVDISVFLRCVAILGVVMVHSGFESLGGATTALIVLIGYSMARFQSNALLEGRSWKVFWDFSKYLLPVYYGFLVLYMYKQGNIDWWMLLLADNLIEHETTLIFPFWFVQVLLQIFMVVGVLLGFAAVRSALKRSMWSVSVLLLLGFALLRYAGMQVWAQGDGLPFTDYAVLFWLGWCVYFSNSLFQKITVAVLAGVIAATGYSIFYSYLWSPSIVVGLLCFASVRVPGNWVASMLRILAASTMAIFILNGMGIYAVKHVVGIGSLPVAMVAGLVPGIAAWVVWRWWFDRRLAKQ